MANFDAKMYKAVKKKLEQQLGEPNADFLKLMYDFYHRDADLYFTAQANIEKQTHEFQAEMLVVFDYHCYEITSGNWQRKSWFLKFYEDIVVTFDTPTAKQQLLKWAWFQLTSHNNTLVEEGKALLKAIATDDAKTLIWLIQQYQLGTNEFYKRVEEYVGLTRPGQNTE
ncbi:MAG: hypothetical protein AAFR81_26580 [Chloroflexota bacterium]